MLIFSFETLSLPFQYPNTEENLTKRVILVDEMVQIQRKWYASRVSNYINYSRIELVDEIWT